MSQTYLLATYPISFLDSRGELACALALKQTQLQHFYQPENCAVFLCASREVSGDDFQHFVSREEKCLLKPQTTYTPSVIKALTHPILGYLSNAGLRGPIKFWSEDFDINGEAMSSIANDENDLIFVFNFFSKELKIFENEQNFLKRQRMLLDKPSSIGRRLSSLS